MYSLVMLCQAIKPTVLIGSSGVGRTFTKEVFEAMSSLNEVRDFYCTFLAFLLNLSQSDDPDIVANECHAETNCSCSLQSNFTIWMYYQRSLCVESGNRKHEAYISVHQCIGIIDMFFFITVFHVFICYFLLPFRVVPYLQVGARLVLLNTKGKFICQAR